MFELALRHHFDGAHSLSKYKGPCHNLHGHRWEVLIEIKTDFLNKQDMVIDFKELKEIVNQFDHQDINKVLVKLNVTAQPTAETIAGLLYKLIFSKLKESSKLKITVWESPEASITYTE